MISLKFTVQWEFWTDDWIDVGFFDDLEAANEYLGSITAAWPFHAFRVVWRRNQASTA